MGYDPKQFGGLEYFVEEVQQAYWEDDQHLFGVEFGGGISWHLVNCLDCSTRDWRDPSAASQGRWRQPVSIPCPESPHGSVASLQNQEALRPCDIVREASDGSIAEEDAVVSGATVDNVHEIGDVPPASRDSSSDSEDRSWVGEFKDFAGNDSHDKNSDWDFFDDRSDRLSQSSGSFDFEDYQHFAELNAENPATMEGIKERYNNFTWGQQQSQMLGERNQFRGPHPRPTQRFSRNKRKASYFFRLFWDDDVVHEMVPTTN